MGGEGGGLREVADGVEARVRFEFTKLASVGIPQGAEVKLLSPATLVIEMAEIDIKKNANCSFLTDDAARWARALA